MRTAAVHLLLASTLVLASPGCTCGPIGGGDGGDGIDGGGPGGTLVSISIMPADQVLDIDPTSLPSVAYTATGFYSNGGVADLTDDVMWFVDAPALGMFTGSVFTASGTAGGMTTVHAWSTADSLEGVTSLTLRIRLDFYRAGAPADAPTYFTGAAGGTAPGLVYPNDGVLLPPNLRLLEIHWMPGAGNTLFELRFVSATGDVRIYTLCDPLGPGCGFELDEASYLALAETNRGGDEVSVELRGVSQAAGPGGPVGEAVPRTLRFSADDLLGGLYYWAATPGNIMRYDFGLAGQTAELYYGPSMGGGLCVGCHALSRSGDRIAIGSNIPSPAGLNVLDVATRTSLFTGASNFETFSPDSSLIITSDGNSMVLHDAVTGTVLQPNPLVASGTMPDWSPDGLSIVFARPAMAIPCPIPAFCGVPGIDAASLFLLTVDATGTMFGPETLLATEGGANYYYPAYSPDGEWVAYNRSTMSSYDAPDADLYVIRADGSGTGIFMANADEGVANSWPKWAPFENAIDGAPLMWIAFSSRRDYGLRLVGQNLAQIWMAAVVPEGEIAGSDPSYPGFWLPYQDLATGNHIPQWSEEVLRQPCTTDGECAGNEFCKGMVCIPIII